jgi:hypothetical protein
VHVHACAVMQRYLGQSLLYENAAAKMDTKFYNSSQPLPHNKMKAPQVLHEGTQSSHKMKGFNRGLLYRMPMVLPYFP